jgi:ankyrin repeat protein
LYCSRECQKEHWKNDHKVICEQFVALQLQQAIKDRKLHVVRELSTMKKAVNTPTSAVNDIAFMGHSLFHCVRYNNIDALKIILEAGQVDVAARSDDGDTCLHFASYFPFRVQMMQLLLQHGADPDALCRQGFSCLMMAALDGRYDEAKCLLEAGADARSAYDFIHRCPLERALEGRTIQLLEQYL